MTGKILVVDDIEQNVKLLEVKLSNEYFTVFSCYSGIEALKQVEGINPDLILLDVMMPEMDGFETCRRLKANPATAHIPVVMVTALSEQEDRIKGLESGATDFITKPIDEIHLFARVKSLIRVKMMLDELRLRDKTGAEFGMSSSAIDPSKQRHTGNVLIIDDDSIQSEKIRMALNKAGHNAKVILDPSQTIEMLDNNDFDMVIVSTMLDDEDGLRLGLTIKAHQTNRYMPVIILIDDEERSMLAKGLEVGIDDYLMCPLDVNELLARCYTQMQRKHYQDALKESYEESVSAAVVDSLTKLYNRRYLDAHLGNIVEDAKRQGRPVALMTIDIDHFKNVNDRPGWGHHIGDECLIEVAKRIKKSTRTTDLCTRPGGEEFVIILPNTSLELGLLVAERIRQTMSASPITISADPGFHNLTISIGVASLVGEQDNAAEMLKRTDEALYRAKDDGRNRVITLQEVDVETWQALTAPKPQKESA